MNGYLHLCPENSFLWHVKLFCLVGCLSTIYFFLSSVRATVCIISTCSILTVQLRSMANPAHNSTVDRIPCLSIQYCELLSLIYLLFSPSIIGTASTTWNSFNRIVIDAFSRQLGHIHWPPLVCNLCWRSICAALMDFFQFTHVNKSQMAWRMQPYTI